MPVLYHLIHVDEPYRVDPGEVLNPRHKTCRASESGLFDTLRLVHQDPVKRSRVVVLLSSAPLEPLMTA